MQPSLSLQLCLFPNFTNSKTLYLKGVPLDLTQKAWFVCELYLFRFKAPKGITHKPFELFEFRQLEHLLEIMCYRCCDFDSRIVQ